MKKITLFFVAVLCMLNVAKAQMLFDFDTVNADQTFTEVWNGTWPNTAFVKVANPDASGINTSSNVGQYTANGGADAQLNSDNIGEATLPAFDFATNPYLTMKVWVDKPLNVTVEFKNNGYYPSFGTLTQSVTTINQWVTVEFDCSEFVSGGVHGWGTYNIIGVSFDKDLSGGTIANDIYYFDDIKLLATSTLSTKDFVANSIKYFPNPASDHIYIKSVQKVAIMDLNGRIVKEAINLEKVDISSLVKGVYVLKFKKDNIMYISKLIKN